VLEGMSVLQQMSQLPTAKANTDSPFFKTAKTIGDSRATVAEKGFGRPLGIKVVVKASNLLSADN
jgi:peptidyl-prolyl cis-trans isomerase B (cyclophilin B)